MSWKILACSVLILGFAAGGDKAITYTSWWFDGHRAIAQAKDALELVGVQDVDNAVTVAAPSRSRLMVAGHVRTTGGTLPFCVQFAGAGRERVPVKVTVGTETLLPRDDATTRQFD